jgi:hypothetical protein
MIGPARIVLFTLVGCAVTAFGMLCFLPVW